MHQFLFDVLPGGFVKTQQGSFSIRAYSNISVKSVADCDKIERSQEAEYGQEEKQRTE